MPNFLRDKQGSTILKTLGAPQELWSFPALNYLIFGRQSPKPSVSVSRGGVLMQRCLTLSMLGCFQLPLARYVGSRRQLVQIRGYPFLLLSLSLGGHLVSCNPQASVYRKMSTFCIRY